MNLHALMTKKTFCYLTKQDFVQAFGKDQTVFITKDLQKFQLIMDDEPPSVMIKGTEVRPVKFLVVNNEKESIDSMSDEEIANLNELVEESFDKSPSQYMSRTKFKKTDDMILFTRKMASKPLSDHDQSELSQIASKVLKNNRHKGKSKFYIVSENNLGSDSDPGFVQLDHPSDVDYEKNYSFEPPSIHDLYDLDALPITLDESDKETYEVEDEDMIEEYIIDDQELMAI